MGGFINGFVGFIWAIHNHLVKVCDQFTTAYQNLLQKSSALRVKCGIQLFGSGTKQAVSF